MNHTQGKISKEPEIEEVVLIGDDFKAAMLAFSNSYKK